MSNQSVDERYMRRALALAERGRGWVSPNPMVGAVVVRDGRIVGEGYHERVGEAHAEPNALAQAGEQARGADLYVTLEPCCHHGRTPPCTTAVLSAGIVRVVVAMTDPDVRVAEKGLALLRAAGVTVEVGLLEEEAQQLNAAYAHHRITGHPYVVLKWAQTLDGRVATATGHSQWITNETSRRRVHQLRSESDAVLVGIGTLLADDPQLTARGEYANRRQPARIVLDSLARTPLTARVFDGATPTILCVTERAPQERLSALQAAGAEVLVLPESPVGKIDLIALKRALGERQIVQLMVEGGPQVATSFLRVRAVDRTVCFIAPIVIGTGIDAIGDLQVIRLPEGVRLCNLTLERLGDDLMLTGEPTYG